MKRIFGALLSLSLMASAPGAQQERKHLLYVAVPGIRNLLEYGGAGVLVYDMDAGHALLRRIKTNYMDEKDKPDAAPENVKVGHIDAAQAILRRDLIGDQRWPHRYTGDGRLLKQLIPQLKSVIYLDELLAYHNRLRPTARPNPERPQS